MTILKHELRRGRAAFWIWTGSVGFLLAVCIFLYPEMKGEMESVGDIFASMGSFTAAFGMDRLNFGTLLGYYAIECGNVLGLGGAFYAALTAASALCKEERDRTADFLLTHPVTRVRVLWEKLGAVALEITALNGIIFALSIGSIAAIGEPVPWKELGLLHLAYYLLQLELAGILFGVSAALRRGGAAVGLGMAAGFYALNLIANLTDSAAFLKWITPYGYCDGASIVNDGTLDWPKLAVGAAFCAAGILIARLHYPRKDIR